MVVVTRCSRSRNSLRCCQKAKDTSKSVARHQGGFTSFHGRERQSHGSGRQGRNHSHGRTDHLRCQHGQGQARKAFERLYRAAEMIGESESFEKFQNHRQAGLMCQLPRLANVSYPHDKDRTAYPKSDLDEPDLANVQVSSVASAQPIVSNQPAPHITLPGGVKKQPPPKTGPEGIAGNIKSGVKWLDLPSASSGLKAKFEGDYSIFDQGPRAAPPPTGVRSGMRGATPPPPTPAGNFARRAHSLYRLRPGAGQHVFVSIPGAHRQSQFRPLGPGY